MGDRLGVAESLVGAAAVVVSADRAAAAALLSGAERLRTKVGAVATPREAAEVASVRAALNGLEAPADGQDVRDEASMVTMAVHALEDLERLGDMRVG
jgi:hypothetical protein